MQMAPGGSDLITDYHTHKLTPHSLQRQNHTKPHCPHSMHVQNLIEWPWMPIVAMEAHFGIKILRLSWEKKLSFYLLRHKSACAATGTS